MKWLLASILQLTLAIVLAQSGQVFNVRASSKIKLLPAIDTLVAGNNYMFEVSGIKPDSIKHLTFTGGTVTRKGKIITLKLNSATSAALTSTLSIFTGSNLQPYWQKEFIVMPQPPSSVPVGANGPLRIYCWNKGLQKKDTIRIGQLLTGLDVMAHRMVRPYVSYSTISFQMVVKCGNTTKTYFNNGSLFATETMTGFKGVEPGCTITLKDIKYTPQNASPDVLIAGPFEVYIKP